MANTKSAERRARSNERKRIRNKAAKTKLRQLEKKLRASLTSGTPDERVKLYRDYTSAFDRAAKSGVVHKGTADRKKSRLAISLNKAAKAPAAK
jgi:small subunit ribosomal protein S20